MTANNKYYNMRVNLIKNGHIYAENVAVRNIWQKNEGTFFDLYFHRLKKSFVFDAVFIHDLYNINEDLYYKNVSLFIQDFFSQTEVVTPQKKTETDILQPLLNDITILLFMARSWGKGNIIKKKIIFNYIQNNIPQAKNFSDTYLNSYISSIQPEAKDFYQALQNLKNKTPKQARELFKQIVQLCRSDGHLHYSERMYLADIFQSLRQEGVILPENII